jgi:prophage regulatory protein
MQRPTPQSSSARADIATPLFLRMPAVMRMTGLGRSTIYRMVADKRFPGPVRLGPRAVAWRRTDLEQWSDARPMAAH